MGFVNQLVTGYWTKIQSNGLALASRVPPAFFLCPWCNSHSNAKVQQTMPLWECEFEGMCMSVQTIICLRGRIALSDKMIRLSSRSRIEIRHLPMIGGWLDDSFDFSASWRIFLHLFWPPKCSVICHMMSYDSCSTKKLEKFVKSVSDMVTKCHVYSMLGAPLTQPPCRPVWVTFCGASPDVSEVSLSWWSRVSYGHL